MSGMKLLPIYMTLNYQIPNSAMHLGKQFYQQINQLEVHDWKFMLYPPVFGSCTKLKLSVDSPNGLRNPLPSYIPLACQ